MSPAVLHCWRSEEKLIAETRRVRGLYALEPRIAQRAPRAYWSRINPEHALLERYVSAIVRSRQIAWVIPREVPLDHIESYSKLTAMHERETKAIVMLARTSA